MTNCSFLHFEKMLVDSKETHHANKHADRLTIFSPTFTLGTEAQQKSASGSLCAQLSSSAFQPPLLLTTAQKWHGAELYLPWNNNVYKQSNAVVLQPPSLVFEISKSHLNHSSLIVRRALEKCQQKPGALGLPSVSENISTFKGRSLEFI